MNDQYPQYLQPRLSGPESHSGDVAKRISFELVFNGQHNYKGRLPMNVDIFPNNDRDEIVSAVKKFHGLYNSEIVTFQDRHGRTLDPSYENFAHNMRVFVKGTTTNPSAFTYGDGPDFPPPMPAQILNYGHPPSRPASRPSRQRSMSPKPRKYAPLPRSQSRGNIPTAQVFQTGLDELNNKSDGIYADNVSEHGAGSVTSSRQTRTDQLVGADISVDNIVAGGRRQLPRFESSELPLYIPPQIPAPMSISSVSPQRRAEGYDITSPGNSNSRNFSWPLAMPTPVSNRVVSETTSAPPNNGAFQVPQLPAHKHQLRARNGASYHAPRSSFSGRLGAGILPTPDPTVASCISDEDVALQLMRLSEGGFSHGRTSASTLADDTFSGRADQASSVSDDESDTADYVDHLPPAKVKAEESLEHHQQHFHVEGKRKREEELPSSSTVPDDEVGDASYQENRGAPALIKKPKARSVSTSSKVKVNGVSNKKAKLTHASSAPTVVLTGESGSVASKDGSSVFHHAFNADEEDLSAKPRCQRCRKSKKGCDRQRPCGRCVDAGIGIDGCISECEGNGRKGRYGRHMGVTIKRSELNKEQGLDVLADGTEVAHDGVSDKKKKK